MNTGKASLRWRTDERVAIPSLVKASPPLTDQIKERRKSDFFFLFEKKKKNLLDG